MPCFYCGKRVSLVRQLTDADFCSEEHRKRYHQLTRSALSRLLEANKQFAPVEVRPEAELEPVPAVPAIAAEPANGRYPELVSPRYSHRPSEPQAIPVTARRPQPKRKPRPPEAAFVLSHAEVPSAAAGLPRWTELNGPQPTFSGHTEARGDHLVLRAAEFAALRAGHADRSSDPLKSANASFLFNPAYIDHFDFARALSVIGHAQVQLRGHVSPWVRPATRPADVTLILESRGRNTARATLVRMPAKPPRIAGLDQTGPVDSAQPSGTHRGEARKVALDFLSYRPAVQPGRFHDLRIPNQLAGAGLQTFRIAPRTPASSPVEARGAFRPVQPVWSLRTTPHEPGLSQVSGHNRIPEPRLVSRAARPRVAPPMLFSAVATLPESLLRAAGEFAAITPQAAGEWFIALPGAKPRFSAARIMPSAVFSGVCASVPQLRARTGPCRIVPAEVQPAGCPAAVRPATARSRTGSARPLPLSDAAIAFPEFGNEPRIRPLAAEGGWLLNWKPGVPAAPRRGRPLEAPSVGFAALSRRLPHPPQAAVPPRVLSQPAFESNPAAAAHRKAVPVAVPTQFRKHTQLLRLPAAIGACSTGVAQPLSGAGILDAIRPGRPVARESAPLHSAAPAFMVEARTPVCPFETRSALGTAGSFAVPAAAARRGERETRGASASFGLRDTVLPGFEVRHTVSLLPTPDPEFRMPHPLARPREMTQPSPPAAFRSSGEIRLRSFTLAPVRPAAVLAEQPLEECAGQRLHALRSAPRALPATQISCRTLFPGGPAPAQAARQLPRAERESISAAPAPGKRPSSTPVRAGMPGPAAELPPARSKTAAPLTLGVPAVQGIVFSPPAGPRKWTASSWALQAPATPVISAQASLFAPGSLHKAQVAAGEYLQAMPKQPRAAVVQGSQAGFKAHDSLLPASRGVSAREELATVPPHTAALRPAQGAAPAVRRSGLPFPVHGKQLPDIAHAEKPAVRVLEERRLGERAFIAATGLRHVDLGAPSRSRTSLAPIAITSALGKAAGRTGAAVLQTLGTAALDKLPFNQARTVWPKASAARTCAFDGASPLPPASANPARRGQLGTGGAARIDRQPSAGRLHAETVRVVPESTQPAEFPAQQPLEFRRRLTGANPAFFDGPTRNRQLAGTVKQWAAFGRESGLVMFTVLASRAQGVAWPTSDSFLFAHEPEQTLKAGRAHRVEPRQFAPFSAPALTKPVSAGYRPWLSGSPAAKLPEPRLREDDRSRAKTVRTTPLFRPVSRPSRVPAFHASVERAHMPCGVFHLLEFEDHDDYGTAHMTAGCPAPLPAPGAPQADLTRPVTRELTDAGTMPVFAGPYGGTANLAGGYSEPVYNPGIFFFEEGTHLLGMDFESIAETYSPRWRSALKTASGFFRGVMLFIPGLVVLSTILTGCSANGGSLRESIQSRATIRIENDFSAGMDGWYGGRDWAKSWTRDPAGFVRAGQLALYRPTLQLSDYRLEFFGQVAGRSVCWVFRAADLQNYYATKLVVVNPGPLPQMALVRYQVIGGQESQSVQIPIRMVLHNGRPYRIQQTVEGSGFTTAIEGQVVDFWTDDRLRAGGVGFFGEKEDRPHIYWMKVINNDDFWGKLCGTIAPSN